MKRLLLSLMALAGIVSVNAQTVLWENAEGVEVSWSSNAVCNVSAAECASFSAGDEIIITVTGCDPEKDAYPQVVLKTGGWGDLWSGGADDNYSHLTKDKEYPYLIKVTLTEEIVTKMKAEGFLRIRCRFYMYKGRV